MTIDQNVLQSINEAAQQIGAQASVDEDGTLKILYDNGAGGFVYGAPDGSAATNIEAYRAIYDIIGVKELLDEDKGR